MFSRGFRDSCCSLENLQDRGIVSVQISCRNVASVQRNPICEVGLAAPTSGASLAQVHGGLQAVLSVQQVREVMEDGGKLQQVFAAAHVPELQPGLL